MITDQKWISVGAKKMKEVCFKVNSTEGGFAYPRFRGADRLVDLAEQLHRMKVAPENFYEVVMAFLLEPTK